jgi:predicted TIM-barrel fold metal-dependent hydrolase
MSTASRLSPPDIGVLDVVDAHLHVWRLADLPWLHGPEVPRIFGAYQPIRRDYPITDNLCDARPLLMVW